LREIWVFAETFDEGVRPVSIQLLGKAKELALEIGGCVAAVVLGGNEEIYGILSKYGAEKIYAVEGNFEQYRSDVYSRALVELIKKHSPYIFIFGATHVGRELAPSVAAELKLGLTADCTGLSIIRKDDEDLLLQTRPAFGGNLMAEITCKTFPQMATVRPNVMREIETDADGAEVIIEKMDSGSIFEILEKLSQSTEHKSVENAGIVVAGGRGLKKKEDFAMLEELASIIGGTVGCSRPIVEKGWMPKSAQVGQSGKTISPDLYIAVGISGSVQHQAGMNGAKKIVAINSDPSAPIMDIADYSLVGDLYEIVPELIRELKENHN
jgi:electron transfer flavoprotein alpha subunit